MKNNKIIPALCLVVAVGFALILIIPSSREMFKLLSSSHLYIMGFIKFGLLATMGELLAIKLSSKRWDWPVSTVCRVVIWGAIGIAITYMMKCFSGGVDFLIDVGMLPGEELLAEGAFAGTLLRAFCIAVTMNVGFGPTFMAFHKCTDKWLELKSIPDSEVSLQSVIGNIDWSRFVSFTLFKTVPIFWVPAHTITFLLPPEYQVMMAASLSVALGVILSIKK